MAQELRQNLRLSQQLVMTPQLQLAIRLLQLSRLELVEAIREEVQMNPLLELEEGGRIEVTPATNSKEVSLTEASLADEKGFLGDREEESQDSNYDQGQDSKEVESHEIERDIELYDYLNMWRDEERYVGGGNNTTEDSPLEAFIPQKTTLTDHLLWQLNLARFNPKEYEIGVFIIGNIDKDGYLRITIPEIAETFNVEEQFVEGVLKKIQDFDPVGVGARDLRECLLAQIKLLPSCPPLVKKIVEDYLSYLEEMDYHSISKELGVSLDSVINAVKVISSLEPKPGRAYSDEGIHYIVPDVYIYRVDDKFAILLNDDGMPKLKLSRYYRDILKNEKEIDRKTCAYLKDKLRSAIWFMKSIHQRQRTIYKVVSAIVDFQKEFLEKGIKYLRPLILKDVAEVVGLHESTVSRVTANKFAHTPQGIFELKFFFSKGLNKGGENIASEVVKEEIKKIITSEDSKRPYTDQAIVSMLRRSNVNIARRTVAKYREAMGIPPASKRRKAFRYTHH